MSQADDDAAWNGAHLILRHGTREEVAALRAQLRNLNPDQVAHVPWDIRAKGGLPLLTG